VSTIHWKPSPALAQATMEALQHLAIHHPKAMALARDTSEAAATWLRDYAFALQGVSITAIPVAALRWVATQRYAPSASEFAALAQTVAREQRATHRGCTVEPFPGHAPPPIQTTRRTDLIEAVSRVAAAELRDYAKQTKTSLYVLVVEMWALLYHTAQDNAQRCDVYDGTIPADVVDDAIAAIKRGRRSPEGPMKQNLATRPVR